MVFSIVSASFVFGSFMTLTRLPPVLVNWLLSLNVAPLAIILLILAFYIIMGTFLEPLPIIFVTVPLLAPVVSALGYDLVWFAVLLNLMCLIGSLSPPFGNILGHMKAAMGDETSMGEIILSALPFMCIAIVFTIVCVLLPDIILLVPNSMY